MMEITPMFLFCEFMISMAIAGTYIVYKSYREKLNW